MAASGIARSPASRFAELAPRFPLRIVALLLLLATQTRGHVVLAAAAYGANVGVGSPRGGGSEDVATGPGGGSGSETAQVQVYDPSGGLLRSFLAFGNADYG